MNLWVILISLSVKAGMWVQTDWSGGPYQAVWSDTSRFFTGENVDITEPGVLKLKYTDWRNWWIWPPGDDSICQEVYSIIKGIDGNLYLAGKDENTLKFYKSANSGKDWEEISEICSGTAYKIVEKQEGEFYVGVANANAPIFRTTDYGETWEPVDTVTFAGINAVYSLAVTSSYIYAGADNGVIFRSTDGENWGAIDTLPYGVRSILTIGEEVYVGLDSMGLVFKLDFDSFVPVDTITALKTVYVLETINDTIYAAGDTALLFKYNGVKFEQVGQISDAKVIYTLMYKDNKFLAGGVNQYGVSAVYLSEDMGITWEYADNSGVFSGEGILAMLPIEVGAIAVGKTGKSFIAGYYREGYIESSVFDISGVNNLGVIDWDAIGKVAVAVRTDTNIGMSTYEWDSSANARNGQDLSYLVSTNDGDDYIQYRAVLTTIVPTETPELYEVRMRFENNAPVVIWYEPDSLVAVPLGDTVKFVVHAYDENGDELTYRWYLNGERIYDVEDSIWKYTWSDYPQEDTIKVEITDGEFSTFVNWRVYFASPEIEVVDTMHEFGEIAVGDSADWQLNIKNTGPVDLIIFEVTSSDTNIFKVIPQSACTVKPGDSVSYLVRFKPDTSIEDTVNYEGVISIVSNDWDEGIVEVHVTGTGVKGIEEKAGYKFAMMNIPNPFTKRTVIKYELPCQEKVTIKVYDASGRCVNVLVDGLHNPGQYELVWDGRDKFGRELPSGSYFYVLSSEKANITRKALIIR